MAPRRAPVLAAEAGRVKWWTTSSLAGCMLYLYGESGTTYLYIHLNNDPARATTIRGGCKSGTTFVAASGAKVQAGELIAWNGDSGDADGNPHLHFEVHPKDGADVNPMPYLKAAVRQLFPARVGAAGDGRAARHDRRGRRRVARAPRDPRPLVAERPLDGARPAHGDARRPDEAAMDGDMLGAVRGLPERFPAGREAMALTVFTTPAAATEPMLRGEPGALVAARISKRSNDLVTPRRRRAGSRRSRSSARRARTPQPRRATSTPPRPRRDRAADDDEHVLGLVRAQPVEDAWHERHVGAREDGHADGVGILLDRRLHDLLRRLVEAGVDHLHSRIAQRACDDLRASIVAVEPRLGDDDPDLSVHGRQVYEV